MNSDPIEQSMRVSLPDVGALLNHWRWCQLLAERVNGKAADWINWSMLLQRAIAESNTPPARFDDGMLAPAYLAKQPLTLGKTHWLKSGDVGAWLTTMGYLVTHDEAPLSAPATNSANGEPEGERWESKAYAYALAELVVRRGQGLEPSVSHLGDFVATKFRKDGVQGDKGPLSGATIKRRALTGIKSTKQR